MSSMPERQEDRAHNLDAAERAVDRAFSTGKADRATITRMAQLDAAEAVTMAGVAMESDEAADDAMKLAIIASNMGSREKAREARERERLARNKAKADHRAATRSAKKAYDAIKFSDPTKLGFMRVVQILFLAHIALTLLVLILTSRDTVKYDYVNIIDWIMVVLETVAFYFFVNRYKLGRPLCIAIAAIGIVAKTISSVAAGQSSILLFVANSLFYIILMLYFIFSDRVKAVLVNDLSHEKGAEADENFVIERRGWPFVRNLIIYFVVFSILGHWMEMAMCQLIRLGIVQGEYDESNTMLWRDWLYPYAMEGAAVVFIALFLYPLFVYLKKRFKNPFVPYLLSFLANMLTCTVIEFFSGLVFNAQLQNWNYTNMPFNFMGQVCLQNALAFGAASSIIAWWVYPAMERAIARVRPATMNIVCVVCAIVGGILFSLYAIAPPDGIDLGQNKKLTHEQVEAKREHGEVRASLDLVRSFVVELEETVDNSQGISDSDRQELKKHVIAIQDELSAMESALDDADVVDAIASGTNSNENNGGKAASSAGSGSASAEEAVPAAA